MTSLRGIDGQVYAVAQGPVVTGGFVAGPGGNRQTVNHPTVGRIANGAIVERASPSMSFTSEVRLQLKQADFTTAARITDALNRQFGADSPVAHAQDAAGSNCLDPEAIFAPDPRSSSRPWRVYRSRLTAWHAS